MTTPRPDPFDPTVLRLASDIRRLGESVSDKDERGQAVWVKVRHGVVLPSPIWATLSSDQRHEALVHATALRMDGDSPVVFSHTSGGALWRLPRVSAWPTRVEVTTPAARMRSSGLIQRHHFALDDMAEIGGLTVTPLLRTLVDTARYEKLYDSVAALDHALHHKLCDKEALEVEYAKLEPGVKGRARARLAIDLAEPGAMSVGESLSRVQMFRLNLPRPELQVEVRDADGLIGACDFGWGRVMGEFDGRNKYGVRRGMDPKKAETVVWAEKRREDRIRATDRRMARWVWVDAIRPAQMQRILAAQGIRSQSKNTWFTDKVAARHPRESEAA